MVENMLMLRSIGEIIIDSHIETVPEYLIDLVHQTRGEPEECEVDMYLLYLFYGIIPYSEYDNI
jgi:hypothetical protein